MEKGFDSAIKGQLKLKSRKPTARKKKTKSPPTPLPVQPEMTPTERRAFDVQRKRIISAGTGRQSHKEKVEIFNRKLEKLSEHHDIPKVGPG